MNQNNSQMQEFETLFRKKLESENFQIPKSNENALYEYWKRLMEICSLQKLDCDTNTFRGIVELLEKNELDFSLFYASFLINGISKVSAKELEVSAEVYSSLLIYSDELAVLWNKKVIPLREELFKKLQTKQALAMPKNGNKVIPGNFKR